MAQTKKILVVDDDREVLELLRTILLKEKKYEVLTVLLAEEALDVLENQEVDLVISDLKMPGMGGQQLLHELRDWDGNLPVIFVSGASDDEDWVQAMHNGASALISKPFRKASILKAVQKALQEKEAFAF